MLGNRFSISDTVDSLMDSTSVAKDFAGEIASHVVYGEETAKAPKTNFLSIFIALVIVGLILVAGPAIAFNAANWVINNSNGSAIHTGDLAVIDVDVEKVSADAYVDRNVILNLTTAGFDENYEGTCTWASANYQYGYGYGYGYNSLVPLNCNFTVGPLTQPGAYIGKIFIDGVAVDTEVDLLSAEGLAVTPLTGNADFTVVGTNYTANANLSVSIYDSTLERAISAVIPSGTTVVASDGSALDLSQLVINNVGDSSKLEIGIYNNGNIYETIQFGVPGVTLYFSQPVEIRMPVSASDGTTLLVKRRGTDGVWTTEGLTTSTGTCTSGIGSPANNSYTVQDGYVLIYTCRASDFVAFTQGTKRTGTISGAPTAVVAPEVVTPVVPVVTPVIPEVIAPSNEETNNQAQEQSNAEAQTNPLTGLFAFASEPSTIIIGLIAVLALVGAVFVVKSKLRK